MPQHQAHQQGRSVASHRCCRRRPCRHHVEGHTLQMHRHKKLSTVCQSTSANAVKLACHCRIAAAFIDNMTITCLCGSYSRKELAVCTPGHRSMGLGQVDIVRQQLRRKLASRHNRVPIRKDIRLMKDHPILQPLQVSMVVVNQRFVYTQLYTAACCTCMDSDLSIAAPACAPS